MPEKFGRHFLKSKEKEEILNKASEKLKVDLKRFFNAKVNVELVQTEFAEIYLIKGKPSLVKTQENIFPTLTFDEYSALMSKVVINMGAVPHVCNGANIMAPGIVRFEGEFSADDFVLVVDEKYGKPMAIGKIVYDSETVKKVAHGVVVKNMHHVGDRIWDFIKLLGSNPVKS
jgi:PUA domain protein